MKKLLFLAAALSAACAASAQGYYTDAYNPDITRHTGRIAAQRAEFILPEVNGYNVYKADLHTTRSTPTATARPNSASAKRGTTAWTCWRSPNTWNTAATKARC